METQISISEWATQTFGPLANTELIMERFLEEVDELETGETGDLPDECADCLIVLYQVAEANGFDLLTAVDTKMQINRARKWETKGDGVGQHVDEELAG